MTPDDQLDHGGHEPQDPDVSPPPLLDGATATIYLDGLIYAAYNQDRKVLESAILTQAEKHHLVIEVRERGKEPLLFPTPEKPWNSDHEAVKAAAPFWLYVDSGNGLNTEFSAELYKDNTDRSFDSIFDFEFHHGRPLPLKPETFAVFNFPHGKAYSADTKQAELMVIPPRSRVANAQDKGPIPVSNLAGIDITAVTNGAGKKSIVLASQNGQNEYFRFELEQGKQYEIKIQNRPVPNSAATSSDHEAHFLQFYELFDVDLQRTQRFLVVSPEEHADESDESSGESEGELGGEAATADNPPCAPGRSGGTGGLGGT